MLLKIVKRDKGFPVMNPTARPDTIEPAATTMAFFWLPSLSRQPEHCFRLFDEG
jgi:hypothetical protein